MAYAGWVLGLLTLLVGAQSSFALKCEGKIYFQPLKSWTEAWITGGGGWEKLVETDGWYVMDASKVPSKGEKGVGTNNAYQNASTFVFSGTGSNSPTLWFTKSSTYLTGQYDQNDTIKTMFSCSDFKDGTSLYIFADPTDSTKSVVSTEPPNAKRLHVLLPAGDAKWMASTPMLTMDGTFKGAKALSADAENCGWYTYTWFNSEPTDEILLVRDDDTEMEYAVGEGGLGSDAVVPMTLKIASLFELFGSNDLYFVMDDSQWDANEELVANKGFTDKIPEGTKGSCSYELAAIIYDTDASLHPAFSCYSQGGEGCQQGAQGVSQTTAVAAVNACIGVTPGLVEETLGDDNKPVLSKAGEKCFISKDLFNQLFNYTTGVNEMSCYDMKFTRSNDGKWEFDSDYLKYDGVSAVGGFYPVENTTDATILAAKADQTPVPAARTKRFAEGPVYYCPALRAIDETEGMPLIDLLCNGSGWDGGHDCTGIFADGDGTDAFVGKYISSGVMGQTTQVFGWSCTEQAPAGWTRYVDGTETVSASGSPRWTSKETANGKGGRNQQFCFESHASFAYKPGLRFNFRGDDDIWVFIDKKLAVDLGGTHLAAPGYVVLDNFKGKSGALVAGQNYDLDIFFCDRRTTMSNVRIKTNMYIKQTTGLNGERHRETSADGTVDSYPLCFEQTGDGSCTSKALGSAGSKSGEPTRFCGEDLLKAKTVDFFIEQSKTHAEILSTEAMSESKVYCGGIDLTDRGTPKINKNAISGCGLKAGGKYSLVAVVDGEKYAMPLNIPGKVDVVYRSAVVKDSNDLSGATYNYKKQSMAAAFNSDGTIDRSQLVPLLITSVSDPCEGSSDKSCELENPLELYAYAAADMGYTLTLTDANGATLKNVAVYANDPANPGKLMALNSQSISRTVDSTGIDTIFVAIPFDEMESAETKLYAKVSGRKAAEVTFFVPKLVFVDSPTSTNVISGDPLVNDSIRWVGSAYDMYVIALNADNTPCGELCNFSLTRGSETSNGLDALSGLEVVNGRATVTIRSAVEYVKCDNPACKGVASLVLLGPNPALMKAVYSPMQFQNPPVPVPVLADIFDVHGATSTMEMNIPTPYFSAETEYLDGIGDSLVVYYHRNFYNHKDSLPNQVVVYWSNDEKDSVVLDKEAVWAARACGKDYGVDDTLCLPRLTFGGVNFSKDVKTGGVGNLKSWATYFARGDSVTSDFPGQIQDRIAPVIVSAKVVVDTSDKDPSQKTALLTVKFSEAVKKSSLATDDKVFSFYLNSEVNAQNKFFDGLASGPLDLGNAGDSSFSATIMYPQDKPFPQSGDYIRFGGIGDEGFIEDYSSYDSDTSYAGIRGGLPYDFNWNSATPYNSEKRLPSGWVLITGDVSTYATRIAENGVTGLPRDKMSEWVSLAEQGIINPVDVYTVDAIKDESQVFEEIRNPSSDGDFAHYGFTPHGWFVKSDMGALIDSKEIYANINKEDVYFEYEVQYFTNLGSYVDSEKGKIYCSDKKNEAEFKKQYFKGGDCVTNRRNFVIIWNLLTDKKRIVGTGAYISKLKAFVKLAEHGKKNKTDRTQMWGVRLGEKGYKLIGGSSK